MFVSLLVAMPISANAQAPEYNCLIVETGIEYETLNLALDAVADGQTIQLLMDIVHNETIVVGEKSFVIDLDDNDLTVSTAHQACIIAANSETLSIVDHGSSETEGVFYATVSGNDWYSIVAQGLGSKISIETLSTVSAIGDESDGIVASSGGEVYLAGDISVVGTNSYAAIATSGSYGGLITIDGEIDSTEYIKINAHAIAPEEYISPTTKPGYLTYIYGGDSANPQSTVWVKEQIVPATTVTQLEIVDAIAPINGGIPASAIIETEQYTGAIAWDGAPESFNPGVTYTATITLTEKEGYTFDDVAENSFRVPCAMSATNEADAGVITATFVSPPEGYITDGNGILAYRYNDNQYLDIKGFHNGSWLQTTWINSGYRAQYILGESSDFSIHSSLELFNVPVNIPNSGLEIQCIPSFANNGKALKITYRIENTGTSTEILSLAGGSDVQIGNNDGAPMERLSDDRGFKMYNGDNQFNFFGINTVDVVNVDTFWFGNLSDLYYNYFVQQTEQSISNVDAAMAYSWHNKTIAPGQTRNFSVLIGIGGAGSEVATEFGINFDSQGGSEIAQVAGLSSGDTASEPMPPTYSGYSFAGWYTEPSCTNEFSFSTPITATITLYAKWTQGVTSRSSHEYYTIMATADNDGNITPSGSSSVRENSDKTYAITPNDGYIISDVLVDGESMGALDRFTFENVRRAHTIEAVFDVQSDADEIFDDVSKEDWFYTAVMHMNSRKMMTGTGADNFSPYDNTTRAMVATIIHNMDQQPEGSDENRFNDVDAGLWYTNAILWASQNGLIVGTGGNRFEPNADITREQLIVMMYNYAEYKGFDLSASDDLSRFVDVNQISPYALNASNWAVGSGLVSGKGRGVLDPRGKATRAEVATMLMNFWDKYYSDSVLTAAKR